MQLPGAKGRNLEKPAPLEAFFFPEVAIVVIAAWSPLGPPAKRGAEIPKPGLCDWDEFENRGGFPL